MSREIISSPPRSHNNNRSFSLLMKRHTTLKVNSKLIFMVKKRVVIVILSMLKQNLDTFLSALTTVSAGFHIASHFWGRHQDFPEPIPLL